VTAPAGGQRLTDRQRVAWLRLFRSEGVGPAAFRTLIARFGSAEAALDALPALVDRPGGPATCSRAAAEAELAALARMGATLAAIGEPAFPPALRALDSAPPVLAIAGSPNIPALPPVAIVGARNASLSGLAFARLLAADLGAGGHMVVSGLARGIDTAAHEGALATGTVAVLAGGLDRPYPPQNRALAQRIVDAGGAVVSEMPLGWEPRARDFPRRNRLIAGLALATVIVEAAERSGSLITARLAAAAGRIVGAVPGSPLDPRAAGANRLLKDGAMVVTAAEDVAAAIRPIGGGRPRPAPSPDPPPDLAGAPPPAAGLRARIVEALGPSPVGLDLLIAHVGGDAAAVHLVLLELDLAGRLERHPGAAVSLVAGPG